LFLIWARVLICANYWCNASKLSLHENHDHAIEITAELSYKLLYNLSNTELATLRQYLNDVLVKEWIKHFISSTDAFILFIFKKNNSIYLCINYWDLNKIIVKNRHLLSLISETLNRFNKVKQFTKSNLKNVYHHLRIQHENEWKQHFVFIVITLNIWSCCLIWSMHLLFFKLILIRS